jgi:hypothetical protein
MDSTTLILLIAVGVLAFVVLRRPPAPPPEPTIFGIKMSSIPDLVKIGAAFA